eukprot:NODE_79_length_22985_cov_0.358401.p6 type:complete len:340 gc:universal NODE_79_length_22985_cov_0.358401:15456-16475(+)
MEHKLILQQFKAPIRHAIGYGSRIFLQSDKTNSKKQIDFIIGTTHAAHFHSVNLEQYPKHYSFLRLFGSEPVAAIQQQGAGVYYNTYCKHENNHFKYGVVTIDQLCSDLIQWNTFFFSGRFQKPVLTYYQDVRVSIANQVNLMNAVRLAICMNYGKYNKYIANSPRPGWDSWVEIPFVDICREIASFSYYADFRTILGIDSGKVDSIVNYQLHYFKTLYHPIIRNGLYDSVMIKDDLLLCRVDSKVLAKHLTELPSHFKYKLARRHFRDEGIVHRVPENNLLDETKVGLDMLEDPARLRKLCISSLKSIGIQPSLIEVSKGLLSAGAVKSFKYVIQKLI